MMLEDNIRNVPENMTMQSNPWVDLFKEHGMNVTYKISGSAADLDTKLNMAIATDDRRISCRLPQRSSRS